MVLEGCSQDTRPAKTDGAANESTAKIAEAANETNNQQLATQQSVATKQPEISTTTEEPKQIILIGLEYKKLARQVSSEMPVCIFTETLKRGMIRKGAAKMLEDNKSDPIFTSEQMDSLFWEHSGKLLLEEDTTGMKEMKQIIVKDMKQLADPPRDCERLHTRLLEMFQDYSDYLSLPENRMYFVDWFTRDAELAKKVKAGYEQVSLMVGNIDSDGKAK